MESDSKPFKNQGQKHPGKWIIAPEACVVNKMANGWYPVTIEYFC